jgi:hypothetical protein
METTSRAFVVAAVALMVLVSLTGCSKDKHNSVGPMTHPLVGTWDLQELSYRDDDGVHFIPVDGDLYVTFKADKTGVSGDLDQVGTFTWETAGSMLKITVEGDTSECKYAISGRKLTLEWEENIYTEVFVRR